MHRMHHIDPRLTHPDRRSPPQVARDTTTVVRFGGIRAAGFRDGGGAPPRTRSGRAMVRSWRQVRALDAARPSIAAPARPVPISETAITLGGMALGGIAGFCVIRHLAPSALRADWLVATIPLLALWASLGGLAAISVARATRGMEPLPELSFVDQLGHPRSALKPIALGVVAGVVLVGILQIAIAAWGWASLHVG